MKQKRQSRNNYLKPKVEIVQFNYEDVLSTSGCQDCKDNTGCTGDGFKMFKII